ncbi:hypothetical protein LY10_02146 [Planktotalea frisia]|jgi:hypothetical protein|uniref:Uncharacterized protein n=1 Tax=Planktotalea frisia TaxID=696762 RepID=A0A1L9NWS2_9RHOB|nr:hypothetical protein [Planktotalea frisia]OJI93691.1 hypothetical protein PFRI_20740 [Planktotalea frisia]PZX28804.1 hypothetical protein LY10_02146 [Planktotalea frisia]
MSDPVINIEIEDVLSSIRRLVSDEARASEKLDREVGFSSDVPPQPVELEQENSWSDADSTTPAPKVAPPALVLTPALRIEPEVDEKTAQNDEQTTDLSSDGQDAMPALILTQHEENAQFDENPSEVDVSDGDSDTLLLSRDIETQQTSAEQATPDAEFVEDQPADDVVEVEVVTEQVSDEVALDEPEQVEAIEAAEEPVTIEDKIAALEALISRSDTDFEPDGADDGANAGRPGKSLPWEDSQEQRVSGLPTGDLPDPSNPSQTAAFNDGAAAFERAHAEAVDAAQTEIAENASETLLASGDVTGVLDEDMLRDMVAEIVRQELQGPLGERITRNVRKLVRREIYRALAANELD